MLDCLTALHSVVSCFMFSSFLILYCKRLRCSAFKRMVTMRRAAVHCCKLSAIVGILWPCGTPQDRTTGVIFIEFCHFQHQRKNFSRTLTSTSSYAAVGYFPSSVSIRGPRSLFVYCTAQSIAISQPRRIQATCLG